MLQFGTAESVMYDVIKICIKKKNEMEVGKETSKKELDKRRIFYGVTHDTFHCPLQFNFSILLLNIEVKK